MEAAGYQGPDDRQAVVEAIEAMTDDARWATSIRRATRSSTARPTRSSATSRSPRSRAASSPSSTPPRSRTASTPTRSTTRPCPSEPTLRLRPVPAARHPRGPGHGRGARADRRRPLAWSSASCASSTSPTASSSCSAPSSPGSSPRACPAPRRSASSPPSSSARSSPPASPSPLDRLVLRASTTSPRRRSSPPSASATSCSRARSASTAPRPARSPRPSTLQLQLPWFGYSGYKLAVIAAAALLLAAVWLLLARTRIGLVMRATQWDRETATAFGIDVDRVYAARLRPRRRRSPRIAAVLIVPISQAHYLMGGDPLLLSFIVVIIGGLGSLRGTVIAALLIGLSDGIISVFFSPTLAKILATLARRPGAGLPPAGPVRPGRCRDDSRSRRGLRCTSPSSRRSLSRRPAAAALPRDQPRPHHGARGLRHGLQPRLRLHRPLSASATRSSSPPASTPPASSSSAPAVRRPAGARRRPRRRRRAPPPSACSRCAPPASPS